jgi:hypothetical protein
MGKPLKMHFIILARAQERKKETPPKILLLETTEEVESTIVHGSPVINCLKSQPAGRPEKNVFSVLKPPAP